MLKSAFGILRRGEGFKAEEFGFEAGDFEGEGFEGGLGFEKATRSTAGFMGDLDGSERAWDGGAFEANSSACDKAIVFVLKPANEAVLGVGAVCWFDLHIAMFYVC